MAIEWIKVSELTTITPTIDDLVPSLDAGGTTLQKTTWQAIRDLFKTYFDTIYQAVLVSGTNIKTINSNSLLWGGDITLPVLANDAVTNTYLANMATATIKGRTTAWTGDPEDLTATQATALLNSYTGSLKWLVPAGAWSSTKYLREDGTWVNPNEWTLDKTGSFTAWGTYDSGTLTTYDYYRIEILTGSSTWSPTIHMRFNNISTASYTYQVMAHSTGALSVQSWFNEYRLCSGTGTWNVFVWSYITTKWMINWYGMISTQSATMQNWVWPEMTSLQLNVITGISGNIKIYWRNY